MFRYFQPQWLYESLPYLYVAIGVATVSLLMTPISLISGGTLILAGAYVWIIRQQYRRRRRAERLARKSRDQPEYTDWGSAL